MTEKSLCDLMVNLFSPNTNPSGVLSELRIRYFCRTTLDKVKTYIFLYFFSLPMQMCLCVWGMLASAWIRLIPCSGLKKAQRRNPGTHQMKSQINPEKRDTAGTCLDCRILDSLVIAPGGTGWLRRSSSHSPRV